MRCTNCGTDNAPDSRFCGGCGAPVSPGRTVPTVKIADDAPIAPPSIPPGAYIAPATPPPGSLVYPAMPQRAATGPGGAPAGMPPHMSPAPAPAQRAVASPAPAPPPPTASPSLSMPLVPRRRWGLIAVVLLVDLGLAAGGSLLLYEGLARPAPAAAPAPATKKPHHATRTGRPEAREASAATPDFVRPFST